MSVQGGFAQNNRFAGLATDVGSNDDTAETIVGTINSHMANLTTQMAATINEHANADECISPAAHHEHNATTSTTARQDESNGNDDHEQWCASRYSATNLCTTPHTDIPARNTTPISTRV